jgi:hypothetical protein
MGGKQTPRFHLFRDRTKSAFEMPKQKVIARGVTLRRANGSPRIPLQPSGAGLFKQVRGDLIARPIVKNLMEGFCLHQAQLVFQILMRVFLVYHNLDVEGVIV